MARNASRADDLVDEILPEEIDWENLVRSYPIPALLVAAVGGFLIGRSRGLLVLAGLSAFASDQVSRTVNELLGQEIV